MFVIKTISFMEKQDVAVRLAAGRFPDSPLSSLLATIGRPPLSVEEQKNHIFLILNNKQLDTLAVGVFKDRKSVV